MKAFRGEDWQPEKQYLETQTLTGYSYQKSVTYSIFLQTYGYWKWFVNVSNIDEAQLKTFYYY